MMPLAAMSDWNNSAFDPGLIIERKLGGRHLRWGQRDELNAVFNLWEIPSSLLQSPVILRTIGIGRLSEYSQSIIDTSRCARMSVDQPTTQIQTG